MVEEGKGKAPVDFELVERRGFHPFYLGMALDHVIDAAVGWKLKSVQRDPSIDTIHIGFMIKNKMIDVGVINVRFSIENSKSHYVIYHVSTKDGVLKNGKSVANLRKDDILKEILVEYEPFPSGSLEYNDDSVASYTTIDGLVTFHFSEFEKHLISISEVPPLGDG